MASQPKPGTKTTEFWLTTVVAVVVAVAPAFGFEISPETQATIIGGLAAVYNVGRSFAKGAGR